MKVQRPFMVIAGVAALITLAAACVAPPPIVHQVDVDNPPKPVIGGLVTSNGWLQIQTFTAGTTGTLDQVDLWIQFTGPGDLLVDIHEVNGTYDLGALIGSGTHNGPATGEVAIPLAQPAPVVAGHRYAISLRQTVSAMLGSWQLSFSATVPLPGETNYVRYPDQDVFTPPYNLSFRTWVLPYC
jgi:hypothetical protein